MEQFHSNLFTENEIPKDFVFPPGKRPDELASIISKVDAPIVDLHDEKNAIQNLMKASQDFGYFQVINHGVACNLMEEVMEVFKELFDLSIEDKTKLSIKEDIKHICKFFTSTNNYDIEEKHYWRHALRHCCNPLEECIKHWPQKPEKYRGIVGAFVTGLQDLGYRILELICEGLGLERRYFESELSDEHYLIVNQYPPCPQPNFSLGLPKHSDPNLITILLPGPIPGYQAFKDGQWMGVDSLPNSFIITIGNQLEVVSNGKLQSGVHRVVTNSNQARISTAFFMGPPIDCIIEPAKPLIKDDNPPLFKPYRYGDFYKIYIDPYNAGDSEGALNALGVKTQIA